MNSTDPNPKLCRCLGRGRFYVYAKEAPSLYVPNNYLPTYEAWDTIKVACEYHHELAITDADRSMLSGMNIK